MTALRKRAYLSLVAAAVIFGTFSPLAKLAFEHVTPLQLMYLRFTSIVPLGLWLFSKRSFPHPISFLKLIALSCITVTSNLLYYIAIDNTTAIEGSLINSTSPIFITLAGILLLKEQEDRNEWIGLACAVIGSTMIILFPFINALEFDIRNNLIGNTIMLGKVAVTVLEIIVYKKWIKEMSKTQLVAANIVVSAFVYGIATAALEPIALTALTIPIVGITTLIMGLVGTVVAYHLIFYGYQHIEASEAALFSYLQPLVYIPLSIILLAEQIIPGQLIGLTIVLMGVVIAEKRAGPATS